LAAAAVTTYLTPHLIKRSMYYSACTGERYIQELLHAHPDHICDILGVSKHVFLVHELSDYGDLQDTKHVSQEEQLAIFL
ncbi:hypothetical protein K466DRAFT_456033, partial [Polyporus arcularius HHB13444]